jgi:hypothetical protein
MHPAAQEAPSFPAQMQIYLDHHRSGDRGETSMPYQDFRQFLDVLRQHGELIDVNRPIALNDVGKAMKQSYVRQGPALMFNHDGYAIA